MLCFAGKFNIRFQKTCTLFLLCFVCNKVGIKYNFREATCNAFCPMNELFFKAQIQFIITF